MAANDITAVYARAVDLDAIFKLALVVDNGNNDGVYSAVIGDFIVSSVSFLDSIGVCARLGEGYRPEREAVIAAVDRYSCRWQGYIIALDCKFKLVV